MTTRFWDCCKPSCGWKEKGPVDQPVLSCGIDNKPIDINAGTGCNGGAAYLCSDQQPWAINDTFSYGFAGAFIMRDLTGGQVEEAWCCACYQLDFTSDPLRGKSMIIQASNTAYDITTSNRFSLAVSGTPQTWFSSLIRSRCLVATPLHTMLVPASMALTRRYLVPKMQASIRKKIAKDYPSLYGKAVNGVSTGTRMQLSPRKCAYSEMSPYLMWYSTNFKRVACPSELTSITKCTRTDDKQVADGTSPAPTFPPSLLTALLGAVMAVLLI